MALSPNAQFAYDYFRRNGMSDVAAAGLVGTLMGESGQGLDTGAYNPNDPGGAHGILQATGGSGRAQALAAYTDPNAKSELERQLSYVLSEMRGTEKKAGGLFGSAKSLEDATAAGLAYLRPADQAVGGENYNRRLAYARGVLGSSGAPTGPAPMGTLNTTSTAPAPTYTNQDLSAYYARKGIDTSGFGGALNKGLYEALAALPPELRGQVTISSGYRSPERQAQLWQQALAKYKDPNVARRWVAPPGRSQHGFGNAADLQFKSDAARQWMHANAERYGLAFPLANEAWHVEAAGARPGGTPVNYALGVSGGGAAPGGVMTATGDTPEAPIQTANSTEAGVQAFNEAFAAQQQSDEAAKVQQAQAAAQEAQQQAQQAQQQTLQPKPGNPSQDSAASLMASLLDKKRIARAGPVPGVLSAWSA